MFICFLLIIFIYTETTFTTCLAKHLNLQSIVVNWPTIPAHGSTSTENQTDPNPMGSLSVSLSLSHTLRFWKLQRTNISRFMRRDAIKMGCMRIVCLCVCSRQSVCRRWAKMVKKRREASRRPQCCLHFIVGYVEEDGEDG